LYGIGDGEDVASGLDVVGDVIPPNVTNCAVRREPDGDLARLEAGAGSVEIDLLLDRVLLVLIVVAEAELIFEDIKSRFYSESIRR
jgi:hypothetical protein